VTAGPLEDLVAGQLGRERARALLGSLVVHPALVAPAARGVPRAVIAQALAIVLFDDFLGRVPDAAAYAEARLAAGRHLHLDHGAIGTVAGVPCGELAEGEGSVARFLAPLGYAPCPADDPSSRPVTGRPWRHPDLPAHVPQYLITVVHADRFPEPFRQAAARVVGSSRDPLTGLATVNLARLAAEGRLDHHHAESLLGELASCFQRHHATPALADYELVRAESEEMAWIATDGPALRHAAVRVDDLVSEGEAPPAGLVERSFRVGERSTETRMVPGPFLEVVSRHPLPDGSGPDLTLTPEACR
jgi:hypothetical protein